MLHTIWNILIYQPIYNALVFFAAITNGNIGLAVIFLTLIVKIILYPLGKKSIITQLRMKVLQPELAALNSITDKAERGRKTIELYKKYNISPFSTILLLIIQLPIILALYFAIRAGLTPDATFLYPFVHFPATLHTQFLGIFNLSERSLVLALFAGVAQFIQALIISPTPPKKDPSGKENFSDALSRNMNVQMKYIMPIMITFFAYQLTGVVALYWAVNSLFSIVQELIVRRNYSKRSMYDKKP